MSPSKEQHTFISYSRSNMDFALRLARELKGAGFPIWVDQMDIPVGARWDDELEIALDTCGIFLVILTPASIASSNVKDEIGYAIDNGKRILPVLLEKCNVPLRLRRFQHIDFTTTSFGEGLEIAKQLLYDFIEESKPPQSLLVKIKGWENQEKNKISEKEPVESPEPKSETPANSNEVRIVTQKGKREYFEHKLAERDALKLKEAQAEEIDQKKEEQPAASPIPKIALQAPLAPIIIPKESIWKFGKPEILRGLIGLVIFGIISILFRHVLSSGFLVFFGLAYGPWVGLFTGVLGSVIALAFPNSSMNPLFFGLLGLITGLFTKKLNNFRDYPDILWAVGLGEVITIIGFLPFGIIPVLIGITDWESVIVSFLITFLSILFILPILMLVFAKTVGKVTTSASNKFSAKSINPTVWIVIGAVIAGIIFICGCAGLLYWLYTQSQY